MKKFVIGDIHGNFKGLKQCLERSGFDYENDQLITLGDIVDRGPESYECIEELLKIKNRIDIKGNHDDVWEKWMHTGNHLLHWHHGGISTLQSYIDHIEDDLGYERFIKPDMGGVSTNLTRRDIPQSHINFFKNQVCYYIDNENRCFVHGGFNRLENIENQEPDILFWDRDLVEDAIELSNRKLVPNYIPVIQTVNNFKEIFVGHSPTISYCNSTLPQILTNVIMMDTGGAYPIGKITIMNIETKEYFQSDLGNTLYDNFRR